MKKFICTRCGHIWLPRKEDANGNPLPPVCCPACKSPYWRINRKEKEVKDHE